MERARERGWCALCVHTTTKVLGIGQVSGDEGGGWKLFKIFNSNSRIWPWFIRPHTFIFSPVLPSTLSILFDVNLPSISWIFPMHCNRTQIIIFALSTLYNNSTQSRLVNKLSAARGAGPIPHHTVYVYSGSWGDCNNALAVTSSSIILSKKIPSVFLFFSNESERRQ